MKRYRALTVPTCPEHGNVLGLGDGREWLCPDGHEVARPERMSVVPAGQLEGAVGRLEGALDTISDIADVLRRVTHGEQFTAAEVDAALMRAEVLAASRTKEA